MVYLSEQNSLFDLISYYYYDLQDMLYILKCSLVGL